MDQKYLMKKQCSKCKEYKTLDQFCKRKRRHKLFKEMVPHSICKECRARYMKNRSKKSEVRIKSLFNSTKSRCKRNNIDFNLELSDIIIPDECPVLGIKMRFNQSNGGMPDDTNPSIDRLIPKLGYVKGNIRIISWRANRLRGIGTAKEHLAIVRWLETQNDLQKM